MNSRILFILSILISSHIGLNAQEASQNATLDSQFSTMISDSESYKDYKVIKATRLYRIKKNVKDSINAVKATLAASLAKEKTQNDEIQKLNDELSQTNEDLDNVSNSKNSIEFLGIQMTKSAYKTLMWSIIAGLLATLLYFIYAFSKSNGLTVQTKARLDKIQSEFESYKKRTLDKEQQIMRRLQDEINKR